MQKLLLLISVVLSFASCKKEKEEVKSSPIFYKAERKVLFSESYDAGKLDTTLDMTNGDSLGRVSYVQTFPGFEIEPGYLNIGAPAPLEYKDSIDFIKSYELGFVPVLHDFYMINSVDFGGSLVCAAQIDIETGAWIELHLNKKKLTSDMNPDLFSEKTLHLYLDATSGSSHLSVYLDEEDVSDHWWIEQSEGTTEGLVFRVDNSIEYRNGTPFTEYYGMRIDALEVYIPE